MTDDPRDRLRRRLARLSPAERDALAQTLSAGGGSRSGRLTAYVTASGSSLDAAELTRHLRASLPDYMIPTRFIELDRLPRTPAGKIDRVGLRATEGPDPGSPDSAASPIVAPRTETERRLAEIWMDVLGMDEVGVHDDFFEIGGDSLLSVRVIARAGREGLALRPETFFEHPTIAAQAERLVAEPAPDSPPADQGVVTGEAPLTPIQHWFFERIDVDPDHWNQSRAFTLPGDLSAEDIERCLRTLVLHHDALRLRIARRAGTRVQVFDAPLDAPLLRPIDLDADDAAEAGRALAAACTEAHATLALEEGRLFRALLVEAPDSRRLVLLAHHFVVDGLSWDLLAEDLGALLDGALAGQPVELPPKTTSARDWARALEELAADEELRALAPLWTLHGPARLPDPATRLPEPAVRLRDTAPVPHALHARGREPDAPLDRAGDVRTRAETLDESASGALLEAGERLGASPRDLLVAATCLAWRSWTGARALQLDLEGHGRDVVPGLDVSRTVGWFTTVFPVRVDITGGDPAEAVRVAREALDEVRRRGATHGLLRYLCPDARVREALAGRPRSPILLNYFGRISGGTEGPLRPAPPPGGAERSPSGPLAYPIEINASERGGRLEIRIGFASRIGDRGADAFTAALLSALVAVSAAEAPRFELSGLGSEGIDRVADLLADIDEGPV